MQIPKCKYLRASGERVLENALDWVSPVVSAMEECGHANGHIALSYKLMCARQLVMLPVTYTYIFDYCVVKLLVPWKLLKLY